VIDQGHSRKLKTLGGWCAKCGESILEGTALRASERAFLELKAEVDGVLGPREVAAVREKIGLSQRKAGELLGGGPRAFQKYAASTARRALRTAARRNRVAGRRNHPRAARAQGPDAHQGLVAITRRCPKTRTPEATSRSLRRRGGRSHEHPLVKR
jgi:HTH-type transcriptional regulator/antitoxin MqsA